MSLAPKLQLSTHEPFPIAQYVDGLALSREPWLSPQNAFRRVSDARIFRGRLEKRSGFSRFAEKTSETADTTVASHVAIGSTRQYRVNVGLDRPLPETVSFEYGNGADPTIYAEVDPTTEKYFASPELSAYFLVTDAWVWDVVETGTNNVIGYLKYDPVLGQSNAVVDWELHSDWLEEGGVIDMSFRLPDTDPVMGLKRYKNDSGTYPLLMDTNRVYLYDSSVGYYKPQGKGASYAAYFTGDSEDYFWTWPVDDYIVITNNVDPPVKWDPAAGVASSVSDMPTDWTGGANQLDRCLMAVRIRGRMVYLNTREAGSDYPTRARYTAPGSFTAWNSPLDFVDAPTELGEIVTGAFIGERFFVGFEDGWMELRSTGDAIRPLEWRPFISRFGAVSKLSTIPDNERLLSRSDTTMQALDPSGQYYFDEKIPDLVLGFSATNTHLCVGVRNEAKRAYWWTYVNSLDSRPKNILNASYDESGMVAWSQFNMDFNVFSEFDSETAATWNSLGPKTWEAYAGLTWNEARAGAAGFVQLIGGAPDGVVYVFDSSTSDELAWDGPSSVRMQVETQELAPFPGDRAHMAWIDVYADASSGASLTLTFYIDKSTSASLVRTIDLSPSGSSNKVYRRVPVGFNAAFHRIKIESSSDAQVNIDALVPWFRPGGRVRVFG